MMKEIDRGGEGGCCYFCDGNDNGYVEDDCNGNDNGNDWLSFASWKWWDDSGNYIYIFYIWRECEVEFIGNEGNGRREEKSGLIFCNVYGDGDGNGNNNNSNDWSLFILWQQWDYSGDYIFFIFIFDENAPENLWATKGIGEKRGIGGWFIIIRMETAMAMAMATVWGKKGLGKGGRGGMEGWVCFFIIDIQN